MANDKKIQFKKVAKLPALSASTEGDLFFCKEDETIYVRGTNSYEKFRGNVDTALSPSSTNPVANKVITNALANKIGIKDSIFSHRIILDDRYPNRSDVLKLGIPATVAGVDRLALLPSDQIIIEQSIDGGNTWSAYPITEEEKTALFLSFDNAADIQFPLVNNKRTTGCMLRVSLTGMKFNVPEGTAECDKPNYWTSQYVKYTERYFGGLGVLDIFLLTGGEPITMKWELRKGYNTSWEEYKTVSNLSGWSGRNLISCGEVFGGSLTQLSNYWCWRFTFSYTNSVLNESYLGNTASIFSIKYYSTSIWNNPNSLTSIGHLYEWDISKNVTFPAQVRATRFDGPATKIADYNNVNRLLQIGLSGNGLTSSDIRYVACYTEGDKIKDASLGNFKQWLGVQNINSEYGKFTKHTRSGHYYSNCTEYNNRASAVKNEILIKTTIPFENGTIMPLISIDGYDYYHSRAISKKLYFYINNNAFLHYGYTNTDSQELQIYLSTYIRDSKKYVAISFKYSIIYYTRFKVSCLDIWEDAFRDSYFENWTIEDNHLVSGGTSIIPQDDIVEVPRNKIATDITGDAGTVNGHTVGVNVPSNAKFTDTTYTSKPAAKDGTDVSLVTTGEKAIWNGAIRTVSGSSYISASTANNTTTISAKTNGIEESTERDNGLATALDVKTYVADKTRVDSTLSDTSTNPVQNKVIKVSLDNLNDNIENVASTANTADNTATAANTNATSALSKVSALEVKETTIAGQKVKVGGEITPVQLTKGLQFPTRNVLNLIMSDATACSSSFNTYLAENNITISDYFCAPTMIYYDESDLIPYCGMLYNSPDSGCLTGIFDTSTDEANFDDICKIQFNPSNCTFNVGDSGLTQAPSITINVTTRPTTGSPVTVNLTEYQYKQMIDMGVKKYVSFRQVATINNIGNIVELNFTNKTVAIADRSDNYVYQHICYYSGGIHVFEFNLNSGTKVLTAKMIM